MPRCIFTLDHEIYGNGQGLLTDLVCRPGWELLELFESAGEKMVIFAEAAEFRRMDEVQSDSAISEVKRQLREFRRLGHEIGLHIHPQWANAQFKKGSWELDYSEYNLCVLPEERIEKIVSDCIEWLREALEDSSYNPISFRAGNWLFQPTETAARVLHRHGIKVDSSVFKGGRQSQHALDYRRAQRNGPFWRFSNDVQEEDVKGTMVEVPIYTVMVPFWKMVSTKRMALSRKSSVAKGNQRTSLFNKAVDRIRWRYPLKFDFCRMTYSELVEIIDSARSSPHHRSGDPLVAIGHGKDMLSTHELKMFLSCLKNQDISTITFTKVREDLFGANQNTGRK